MNLVTILWGEGELLNPLQMGFRALAMFGIALILIRFGGMRIFSKKSAQDTIIVIMLGAVMARGVVGASPFWSTVAAAAVMIFVNRIIAWVCHRNKLLNNLIKGKALILYEDGAINWENMSNAKLSKSDLLESLRLQTKKENFDTIYKVFLENNGRISFILKS